MRPARRFLISALLLTQLVVGCDCESMLAQRRREGAPTSSEGRAWDPPTTAPAPPAPPPPTRAPPSKARAEAVAPPPVAAAPPPARVEPPPSEPATRQTLSTRPTSRGFDRLRPMKLPRAVMPAQRIGDERVQPQEAEPIELLDR